MKLISSKKRNSILIKNTAIYVLLFLAAIMVLVDHYSEDALDSDQIKATVLEEKSEAGFKAPAFTARDLKGNIDSLANYKGQVIIVNLWATWCGPCRIEMPGFENLYRRFRSEGLTILAVSLDKNNDKAVKDFAVEYKLSFPILIDEKGEAEKRYQTFTIPTTYVIDRTGRVVFKVDGAKNWESEETFKSIEYLLKAPVT
jgi:peroxiredoxin